MSIHKGILETKISADSDKYLGVGSSGNFALIRGTSLTPTISDAGKVIGIDSTKHYALIDITNN